MGGGPPPIPPGGGGPPIGGVGGPGPPPPPPPAPHGIGGNAPLPPLPAANPNAVAPKPNLVQSLVGWVFTHKVTILTAGAMCIAAGVIVAATALGGGVAIITVAACLFSMSAFFFVISGWLDQALTEMIQNAMAGGTPDLVPQFMKDLASGAGNMISHVLGGLSSISDRVQDWAAGRNP
ncbi:MAG: hypothetical protein Q8K75_02935 [Chlamydiales bacterium]|nr:hypothetical protein [Chlamydiales bacterium]